MFTQCTEHPSGFKNLDFYFWNLTLAHTHSLLADRTESVLNTNLRHILKSVLAQSPVPFYATQERRSIHSWNSVRVIVQLHTVQNCQSHLTSHHNTLSICSLLYTLEKKCVVPEIPTPGAKLCYGQFLNKHFWGRNRLFSHNLQKKTTHKSVLLWKKVTTFPHFSKHTIQEADDCHPVCHF